MSNLLCPSTEYSLKVPFFDVDSMAIAWHGHYCKYFEIARCKLLDELGYNYLAMAASGYTFPIIDLHIKYVKPARFDQEIVVKAELIESHYRLKIRYQICDVLTRAVLTKGHTIQAAVDCHTHEMRLECPPILRQKVRAWLDRVL